MYMLCDARPKASTNAGRYRPCGPSPSGTGRMAAADALAPEDAEAAAGADEPRRDGRPISGTSTASSISPSGSIQTPRTGRNEKKPPSTSTNARRQAHDAHPVPEKPVRHRPAHGHRPGKRLELAAQSLRILASRRVALLRVMQLGPSATIDQDFLTRSAESLRARGRRFPPRIALHRPLNRPPRMPRTSCWPWRVPSCLTTVRAISEPSEGSAAARGAGRLVAAGLLQLRLAGLAPASASPRPSPPPAAAFSARPARISWADSRSTAVS